MNQFILFFLALKIVALIARFQNASTQAAVQKRQYPNGFPQSSHFALSHEFSIISENNNLFEQNHVMSLNTTIRSVQALTFVTCISHEEKKNKRTLSFLVMEEGGKYNRKNYEISKSGKFISIEPGTRGGIENLMAQSGSFFLSFFLNSDVWSLG